MALTAGPGDRDGLRDRGGGGKTRRLLAGLAAPAPFVERRPLPVLATGAAIVSAAPILVKLASTHGVGPMAIAMWRCGIGGAVLLALAYGGKRRAAISPGLAGLLVLAGAAFALDLSVWHASIFLAGAGMATILGNTQVFFTAIIATVLFGERLGARFVVAAVSALAGLCLLVGLGSDVQFSDDYLRGVGFGLATGVVYAVFLTILRLVAQRAAGVSSLARTGWFSAIAALLLIAPGLASDAPARPADALGWLWLVLLALVAQVAGWWAISSAVGRVRASIAGLVLLLQPVLATLWSVLLLGETLAPLQVVGAAVTLAAIYAGATQREARSPAGG